MARLILLTGALLGLFAVALGAYGAHALPARLPGDLLASYQTAVRYQIWHAFAMLVVGSLTLQLEPAKLLEASAAMFALGTVLFCGSLYILALTALRQLGPLNVGSLTPAGGLLLLLGWLLLAIALMRTNTLK